MLAMSASIGCGGTPALREIPSSPLSISEWERLPPTEKYEVPTLERLKDGEPKLNTDAGWESFRKTTLMTHRRKDFPGKR